MNNSDSPAMPITVAPTIESIEQARGCGMSSPRTIHHSGLTKREDFAKAAMQGFISAGGNGMPSYEEVASLAVTYADVLLAALEES